MESRVPRTVGVIRNCAYQGIGDLTSITPKDLASAIAIEAAELMELFLWKDSEGVEDLVGQGEYRGRIVEELSDIVILRLSMANRLRVDVADSVLSKIAANQAKYPSALARGKADKYTSYDRDS